MKFDAYIEERVMRMAFELKMADVFKEWYSRGERMRVIDHLNYLHTKMVGGHPARLTKTLSYLRAMLSEREMTRMRESTEELIRRYLYKLYLYPYRWYWSRGGSREYE